MYKLMRLFTTASFLLFLSFFVVTLLLSNVVYAVTSIHGPYPGTEVYPIGLLKMSPKYTGTAPVRGTLGISTNYSDTAFNDAFAKIKSSSMASTELPTSIWPNGINASVQITAVTSDINYIGLWNKDIDILYFLAPRPPPPGSVGETFRRKAPKEFCVAWGLDENDPCGNRPTIELDSERFKAYTNTDLKQRIIMHEMGHALGLKDNCTEYSIMNNGANDPDPSKPPKTPCFPIATDDPIKPKSAWLQVMSLLKPDLIGLSQVYK